MTVQKSPNVWRASLMRHRVFVGVLMLALLAASCASGSTVDSTVEESSTTTSSPADSETSTTSDSGSFSDTDGRLVLGEVLPDVERERRTEEIDSQPSDPDGVFHYGFASGVSCLDPHQATSVLSDITLKPVYDYLIRRNTRQELEPLLAESWTPADDGSYLELELRDDVVFHDGTPFNAEAVKSNIDRAQSLEGGTVGRILSIIQEIEIVDEFTVRLHAPDGGVGVLPYALSSYPGAIVSPTAFENGVDLCTEPVGAGPFVIKEHREGDRVSYERFDDYWDPEAAGVAELQILSITNDDTRLNALLSGQLDATYVRARQYSQVEDAMDLRVYPAIDLQYNGLFLNRAAAPMDNPLVRQALHACIDKETLVESKQAGLSQPAVQPYPPGYWAHDPTLSADFYPFDRDRANELLAEAGFADGFQMKLLTTSFITEYTEMIEAVAGQLNACGIQTEITLSTGDVFSEYRTGDFHAAWFGWSGSADPSTHVQSMYTSEGFWNPAGDEIPEIADLHAQGLVETDQGERAEIYQQISRLAVENALNVITYYPVVPHAISDRVQNWNPGLTQSFMDFRGISIAEEG